MTTAREIMTGGPECARTTDSIAVAQYVPGKPVTIGADDDIAEASRKMTEHGVRRLFVVDGDELVGIVSQSDLPLNVDGGLAGQLVEAIGQAPANLWGRLR